MGKTIELLAPAGNAESLRAAVENGADAVYLGGKSFNARQQADNFDLPGLREGLRYAHARGVNIYLTLNTLVSDEEIPQALAWAEEAYIAGIDGIIVQDIGLAALLRGSLPELPLHGSTQMTVYDLEGVRMLEKMGFSRVVLARELTLEQAARIARNTGLEVEIFVHGAMCVCYSGQCLMSSMIGGRSGNRGRCAQPCRLAYTLAGPGGKSGGKDRPRYLLSPKDMNTLEYLPEIVSSGIRSLKIEGRMKGRLGNAVRDPAHRRRAYGEKSQGVYQDMGRRQGTAVCVRPLCGMRPVCNDGYGHQAGRNETHAAGFLDGHRRRS